MDTTKISIHFCLNLIGVSSFVQLFMTLKIFTFYTTDMSNLHLIKKFYLSLEYDVDSFITLLWSSLGECTERKYTLSRNVYKINPKANKSVNISHNV